MSASLTRTPAHELEPSSWTDTSLIGLVIGERELPRSLQRAIIGGRLTRTMRGASMLEVVFHDEDGSLIASNQLQKGLPAKLYHEPFRVARISKQGKTVTVQLEDEAVWQLRQKKGLRVAAAGTTTRLQFAKLLVNEVPELLFRTKNLYARPLLYEPPRAVSRVSRNGSRTAAPEPGVRGFSDGVNFKVKGVKATRHQIYVVAEAMRTADRLLTTRKARLALIEALIQESVCRNIDYGDRDSLGCLQLRAMHGSKAKRLNVAWCVERFLSKGFTGAGGANELSRKNPSWNPGQVAQAVQGSAHPTLYEIHRAEAEAIYREWTGEASGTAGVAPSVAVERRVRRTAPYMRKATGPDGVTPETSWDALLRLGEEVNWRVFARGNVVFMYSDYDLLTSMPNSTIRERDEGVLSLDFDVDDSKRVPDTARLRVIGERNVFPPGTVIVIRDAGAGDGRWLVHETTRNLFDQVLTIDLERPQSQKAEGEPRGGAARPRAAGSMAVGAVASSDLAAVRLSSEWGGAQSVFTQFVTPFLRRRGLSPGSQKRSYDTVAGSGMSDHYTGATSSYAIDYPTFNGAAAARALAAAMGFPGWSANNYARFLVRVGGARFSCQILWGSGIEHGDHIHVGLKRI